MHPYHHRHKRRMYRFVDLEHSTYHPYQVCLQYLQLRQHHQIHKTFDKSGFSCTYRPYNANIDLAARSHLNISIYTQFIHKNTPSISILQSFHILYERGMPLRRMNYLYQRILSLLSSRQFKEHILL